MLLLTIHADTRTMHWHTVAMRSAAVPCFPTAPSTGMRMPPLLLQVGQAFQTFDWDIGQLVSEVDLEVFPGAQGCLVTTSRVRTSVPPTQLQCTVESTRVARSNMLPWLIDPISVPVKVSVRCRMPARGCMP